MSKVTVLLAVFDDELSLEEKQSILANLKSLQGSEEQPASVCVEEAELDNNTDASFLMKKKKKSV